ncbi:class I SAM-dependent methyltransferase [Lentzea sp. HUAS TT2]|uniref:class I SAM-dependent methyltransferase n=1 Tax=Lentzea sp. HUAS TT2 TaxID=3447454 RepID=UPI003F6F7CC2
MRARELVGLASGLYQGRGPGLRLRQVHRPWICPFELIVPHVPVGATVLDAGCGSGLLLGLLAALGRRIEGTGFELSPAALGEARLVAARVWGSGSRLEFGPGDVTGEWPDREFDVVCLVDVLHHVSVADRTEVLRRACAAVKPGGALIYKDMACRPRWRAVANQLHDLVLAREWVRHAEVAQVVRQVVEFGFRLEYRVDTTRLWYAHELRVLRRG